MLLIGFGLQIIIWIFGVLAGLGRVLQYIFDKVLDNFKLVLTAFTIIIFFLATGFIYSSSMYDGTTEENLVFLTWFVFFIPIFIKIFMKLSPSLPEGFSDQAAYQSALRHVKSTEHRLYLRTSID